MFYRLFQLKTLLLLTLFFSGCAVEAAKNQAGEIVEKTIEKTENALKNENAKSFEKGASIKITANSPADTVRVFYKNLRGKRFREALFLTNLRPAIEGLTDAELKDLQVDFEPIARQVPTEIEINGEIISGDSATVTVKLPDNETDKLELQQLKLRKENNYWVILTVDPAAEQIIKKEGRNYFFALRIETHHSEAREMLSRISKAQMVFALQNNGLYADIPQLIEKGLLPADALSAESTGYNYIVSLSGNKKTYKAAATPAVYGKTGKLSFLFKFDGKNNPHLSEKDNGGNLLK
ncbi:MAG: hypothetical protein JWN60_2127 [Acidobacteria bacterium]|jgi:hypothetical protein|nr:hypothetical protein [Acidobacteriota bacterium]